MCDTKEEIERYLEILRSYNTQSEGEKIQKLDVGIVKAIVSLFNQVIIFVILVGQLMVMFLDILT